MEHKDVSFRSFLYSFNRNILPTTGGEALSKELNMFDATFLGVGATVGAGSFIFVGSFSAAIGPAFILTNLFTAGIILMSAMCYADFIRLNNTCGGAYSAAFKHIGELRAAFLGCLLCMEHILTSALAARGLSQVIDELVAKWISKNLTDYMSFTSPFFHTHPDLLGCVISVCALAIVSFDVKTVSTINNCCCLTNLGLFLLITLVSGSNLNFDNWNLPPSDSCGNGGFFPYGLGIVFSGMSKVYISYIGIDSVANAGSEARDPDRTIPLSMIVAVIIVTVLFTLNSFTYTLVWSFCDQDIDDPIPEIMQKIGLDIMKWITSIGLPITMLGNFICNTYPLSRLVYAMAGDGLLCSFLAKVDEKTKTPLQALYTSGSFTAILSELSCLGALSAYNVITYSLIHLSYTEKVMEYGDTDRPILDIIFNKGEDQERHNPTVITSSVVRICCWVIFTTAFPYFLILKLGYPDAMEGDLLAISIYIGFFILYGTITYIIACQPMSTNAPSSKTTMPSLPVFVILVNTYLCLEYDIYTWILGSGWLVVAAIIYMTYGVWNSKAKKETIDFNLKL
ncbi:high affinity cationic amino acid transporter 1 isoform X2 [Halyomorpha halys]|uniref:high affinity cationic amino acid transporter 1 isoform X2 n=1 Tax=Halyomorpha halys TaxID=286706 RepID=UPI0034D208A3